MYASDRERGRKKKKEEKGIKKKERVKEREKGDLGACT